MPRPKSNKPKKGFLDGYKTYNPNDNLGRGSVEQWHATWERMTGAQATALLGEDDPLLVMGFDKMPTVDELDRRFRELMMIHHPDRGGDVEKAKQITAAWTVLKKRIG